MFFLFPSWGNAKTKTTANHSAVNYNFKQVVGDEGHGVGGLDSGERMKVDRVLLVENRSQYSSSVDENSWSVRMLFLIQSVYMGTLTYTPGRLGVAHSTPQLTMPPTNHRSLYPSIGHSSGPPESPCGDNVTCTHLL